MNTSENSPVPALGPTSLLQMELVSIHWYLASKSPVQGPDHGWADTSAAASAECVSHSLHTFHQFDLCSTMLYVFILSGERGREGPKGEPGYPGNTGVNGPKGGPGDLGQEGPAGTGLGI